MDCVSRCRWLNLNNPLYVQYHDTEWGVPVHDDKQLFELLILESFQAGLSWECVLNKRQDFRQAYDGFDWNKVACYTGEKEKDLLQNVKLIRHQAKIRASIQNAIAFRQIQQEFLTFDRYIWQFTDGRIIREPYHCATVSPLSEKVSKDLKQRKMSFVGPTIIQSYLQAIGVINAHGEECIFGGTER